MATTEAVVGYGKYLLGLSMIGRIRWSQKLATYIEIEMALPSLMVVHIQR